MRWPWSRRETRADSSYTDALVAAIAANAGGKSTAFPTGCPLTPWRPWRTRRADRAVFIVGHELIPCSSWHWEGSHDPSTWTVRVTAYGPSTSTTWNLPASAVAFVRWGSNPGQPYIGTAPTSWAHTTARLGA